jgi:hypothetical protein
LDFGFLILDWAAEPPLSFWILVIGFWNFPPEAGFSF